MRGSLVLQTLVGLKTQTRRVIKPQPASVEYYRAGRVSDSRNGIPVLRDANGTGWTNCGPFKCPYAGKGDRKETFYCDCVWYPEGEPDGITTPPPSFEQKRADMLAEMYYRANGEDQIPEAESKIPWSSPLHMPRWASRLTLELVADVRVERVQDITEEDDVLWTGDEKDSGHPRFAAHFRPVGELLQQGHCPPGPLMSAAVWQPGSYQRRADHIRRSPFLVVESDTLDREQIGAVFRWCQHGDPRDCLTLRAVIDTGGRGLHGWFDRPTSARALERWRVTLAAMGCDEGPMRLASMSRLPGACRDNGRRQRLLWLDPSSEGVRPSFIPTHACARLLS